MLDNGLKQFIKYIKYDLHHGLLMEWKKYIVFSAFILFLCLKFIIGHSSVLAFEDLEKSLSTGDLLSYILKGMQFYQPSLTEIYVPEFTWIFMYMYITFSVSYYPLKDLHGYGQLMLLQSKQRRYWWFSKCIWNILSIGIFYFIMIMDVFVCGVITGNINIMPQVKVQTYYNQMIVTSVNIFQFILIVCVVPLVVTIAISLFQMMWAVLVHPMVGLIVSASIYIMSIYFSWPWMMGNYLMLMRSYAFNPVSQVTAEKGILYSVAVICTSGIIGYVGFRKKDILSNYSE